MQSDLPPEHAEPKVTSPFSGTEAAVPRQRQNRKKLFLWIGAVIVVLAIGAAGSFFATRYLNDPYRTLETFPVAKFLENPRSLSGSRFKAVLRVEADLKWKESIGRLMLFSTDNDSRPIAVMVPTVVARDIYFTKGQTYIAELEVKEGGLIYANSCRKN